MAQYARIIERSFDVSAEGPLAFGPGRHREPELDQDQLVLVRRTGIQPERLSGQQEVGYNWSLIYAGLSPDGPSPNGWYQDYWVRNHIQNYAAKVGVHMYWDIGNMNSTSEGGGLFYRSIHDALALGGVSPKGLLATEFNEKRPYPSSPSQQQTQINDDCTWWHQWYSDSQAGYWCEQALIYVTHDDDATRNGEYGVTDGSGGTFDMLPTIQNC